MINFQNTDDRYTSASFSVSAAKFQIFQMAWADTTQHNTNKQCDS